MMPRTIAVVAFALSVTACAHPADCPPAGVKVVYQDRVVETQRPCKVETPKRPDKIGKLPTDAIALAAVLGAKLAEYEASGEWADRMQAALDSCTSETFQH